MPYVDANGLRLFYDDQGAGGPRLWCSCTALPARMRIGRRKSPFSNPAIASLPAIYPVTAPRSRRITRIRGRSRASEARWRRCSTRSTCRQPCSLDTAWGAASLCKPCSTRPHAWPNSFCSTAVASGPMTRRRPEQQTRQRIADTGYRAMMQGLFDDMFVDGADPSLKDRIVQRALQLPEAIGAPLFSRIARWDAGKADATLAQINIPIFVLQRHVFQYGTGPRVSEARRGHALDGARAATCPDGNVGYHQRYGTFSHAGTAGYRQRQDGGIHRRIAHAVLPGPAAAQEQVKHGQTGKQKTDTGK